MHSHLLPAARTISPRPSVLSQNPSLILGRSFVLLCKRLSETEQNKQTIKRLALQRRLRKAAASFHHGAESKP